MGNLTSASFLDSPKLTSSDDLSSRLHKMQISDPDYVVQRSGQVKAVGDMAVTIGEKRVSVPCPSKVFWVGVLLKKKGWVHSGVGLHNDITVKFENGLSKTYQYVVAHATAGEDRQLKIHLCFANELPGVYDSLAHVFGTEVDYSFLPVFAGDSWVTHRLANDVVTKVDKYLGRPVNMESVSGSNTNCIHFSVVMYLYFAYCEDRQANILRKVADDMQTKEYKSILRKIQNELAKISA